MKHRSTPMLGKLSIKKLSFITLIIALSYVCAPAILTHKTPPRIAAPKISQLISTDSTTEGASTLGLEPKDIRPTQASSSKNTPTYQDRSQAFRLLGAILQLLLNLYRL